MSEHGRAIFSLKGTDGLDEGDMMSLCSAMDIFSPERWPAIAASAKLAGASDWQIRKWRVRRSIPGGWHLKLLKACVSRGVSLSSDELLSTASQRAA